MNFETTLKQVKLHEWIIYTAAFMFLIYAFSDVYVGFIESFGQSLNILTSMLFFGLAAIGAVMLVKTLLLGGPLSLANPELYIGFALVIIGIVLLYFMPALQITSGTQSIMSVIPIPI